MSDNQSSMKECTEHLSTTIIVAAIAGSSVVGGLFLVTLLIQFIV
ncbi:hypothetical protein [Jeotgalibacillus marinus]|uniref:Uncharacterized protein n=1 Tax=Jeotgalibacillus marinus TaxID=86667 RepID=A0ABV3Q4I5_9BACL